MRLRWLAFAFLLLLGARHEAMAQCASLPYTFQNGTVADANQMMANLNSLLTCGQSAVQNNTTNTVSTLLGLQANNPSPTATGAVFSVNSSTNVLAANNNYAAILGTNFVGSSSTITNVIGVAGYVRNQITGSGPTVSPAAIGLYSQVTAEVNGANSFAGNFAANDFYQATTSTNAILHGIEFDFNVKSTSTTLSGNTYILNPTAQPLAAFGAYCQSTTPASGVWTDCFITDDGVATTFAQIGAAGTVAANVGSQPIQWRTYNGSGITKTFTEKAYVSAGVGAFAYTSQYTNFNFGINTSTPVDNTGAGYTGLTVAGSVGGVLSLEDSGTEFARVVGTMGAMTLTAENSADMALQAGGNTLLQLLHTHLVQFPDSGSFDSNSTHCGTLSGSTGCLVIVDFNGNTVKLPVFGTL